MLHSTLLHLEHKVRKPLEGSNFDIYIASPAKQSYLHFCRWRKQVLANRTNKDPDV